MSIYVSCYRFAMFPIYAYLVIFDRFLTFAKVTHSIEYNPMYKKYLNTFKNNHLQGWLEFRTLENRTHSKTERFLVLISNGSVFERSEHLNRPFENRTFLPFENRTFQNGRSSLGRLKKHFYETV